MVGMTRATRTMLHWYTPRAGIDLTRHGLLCVVLPLSPSPYARATATNADKTAANWRSRIFGSGYENGICLWCRQRWFRDFC